MQISSLFSVKNEINFERSVYKYISNIDSAQEEVLKGHMEGKDPKKKGFLWRSLKIADLRASNLFNRR